MYFILVLSIDNPIPTLSSSIIKLESTIGKIYNYFGKSCNRQSRLKKWQNFLEMSELKFKKIFDIRQSSIRDCIKPIVANVQPGILYIIYLHHITITKTSFHVGSQAFLDVLKKLGQMLV